MHIPVKLSSSCTKRTTPPIASIKTEAKETQTLLPKIKALQQQLVDS
jgi:hypothetical protein